MLQRKVETMNERPSHQSLLNAPGGMPTGELLSLMFGPLARQWSWAKDSLVGWIQAETGERRPIYAADNGKRTTVRGEFERDDLSGSRFVLTVEKSPKAGEYWTVSYIGVISAGNATLYQRSTLESKSRIEGHPLPPEDMLLPLHAAVASGKFINAGYPVIEGPHAATEPVDIKLLTDALDAADRTLPILAMTENAGSNPWPIKPRKVAKALEGVAHVVTIINQMTYRLTDSVGKEASVYQGYVRLYSRRISEETAPIMFRPESLQGEDGVQRLVARVCDETLNSLIMPPQIPMDQTIENVVRIVPAKEPTKKLQVVEKEKPKSQPISAPTEQIQNLGAQIRSAREAAGLSQTDLGIRIGVSQTTVGLIERSSNPTSSKVAEILEVLGMTTTDTAVEPAIDIKKTKQNQSLRIQEEPLIDEEALDGEDSNEEVSYALTQDDFDNLAGELIGRNDRRIDNAIKDLREAFEARSAAQDARIQALEKTNAYLHDLLTELQRSAATGKINIEQMPAEEFRRPRSLSELQTAAQMLAEVAGTFLVEGKEPGPKTEPVAPAAASPVAVTPEINEAVETQDEVGYPTDLNPKTVEKFLSRWDGRVVLHPKAIKGLKESVYEEPEKVYRVLETLAENYVPMRRGEDKDGELYAKFMATLHNTNLRYEAYKQTRKSIYRVMWNGNNREIQYAIKSRTQNLDQRRCLRIYLIWDEKANNLVVAHLPSHLPQTREVS